MPPSIQILPTAADLFCAAASEFVSAGKTAIAARGRFTVALSGGSTPRSLYSVLAQDHAGFAWSQTHLFFGDERHVPPTDRDSNYRMVSEALLTRISIPVANVHRVPAENLDAAAAAQSYENELRSFFQLPPAPPISQQLHSPDPSSPSGRLHPECFPRFDLILLGMGPDGHTASLFPGSDGLKEQSRIVMANWVAELQAYRITFTFPVLNRAAEVMFLAAGADKADMVHQVLEAQNSPPYPSQQVRPSDGKLLWMLDEAAAAKLSR